MIGVAVELLTGVYRAAARESRESAEWPPHPDRLFMAMLAGHHEAPGCASDATAERAALMWIEQSEPPGIAASARRDRSTGTCYVPTNDDEVSTKLSKIEGLKQEGLDRQLRVLPELRGKKARRFPAAVPLDAVVHFVWRAPADEEVRRGLSLLCAKLTRLGHSASLVRAWVEEAPPACVIEPCDRGGELRLRVPTAGRLALLEHLHKVAPESLPNAAPSRGYRVVEQRESGTRSVLAGHLIVLRRVGGTRVGLQSAAAIGEVLRQTIMQRCPVQPPPEWISGHASDGSPSRNPHIAIIPLPMVDAPHADGHLLGLGVLVPETVPARERRAVLEAALTPREGESALRLWNGDWFEWAVEPVVGIGNAKALTASTWAGPERGSSVWASVTPVVLDRHPKNEQGIAATIADSCLRVGLPMPKAIGLSRSCTFRGGLPAHRFPPLRRSDGSSRRHIHVLIEFGSPVTGPVVIGAGRFGGYGLLKPLVESRDIDDGARNRATVLAGLQGSGERSHDRQWRTGQQGDDGATPDEGEGEE
jgi:CRISPR-associated protein Csb2